VPFDIGLHLKERIPAEMQERGVPVDVKYIDPSYTVRGLPPTPDDAVFCATLGQHAVHAILAGYTDVVIGSWSHQLTYVPTPVATASRQHLDVHSQLWQSVLHLTGQRLAALE
jgi:6-phosphofructokinase 1